MKVLSQTLIILLFSFITILTASRSDSTQTSRILGEVIKSGLKDVYQQTNVLTQRLQQNVVEVVNEGKEKLYLMKRNIFESIENNRVIQEQLPPKSKMNRLKVELKKFENEVKMELSFCTGEVFQYSEQYRHTVKDNIGEIESQIQLRKKLNNCFAENVSDFEQCAYNEDNEYSTMAAELEESFKEIVETTQNLAIEVLSNLMTCNQDALKKAETKADEIRKLLSDCILKR